MELSLAQPGVIVYSILNRSAGSHTTDPEFGYLGWPKTQQVQVCMSNILKSWRSEKGIVV